MKWPKRIIGDLLPGKPRLEATLNINAVVLCASGCVAMLGRRAVPISLNAARSVPLSYLFTLGLAYQNRMWGDEPLTAMSRRAFGTG